MTDEEMSKVLSNRFGPQQNGGTVPPAPRVSVDEIMAATDSSRRRSRILTWTALTLIVLMTGANVIGAFARRELAAQLAAERERNPCQLVGLTLGGLELNLRHAPDDLTRMRVAGAASVVLHPVASKCSGRDSSELIQRFNEGRTLDEQLAALRELRAMVMP